MAEGYCVKDKKKVEIQNPVRTTMKNGKPATQGTCPECGGKFYEVQWPPVSIHELKAEGLRELDSARHESGRNRVFRGGGP